MKHIHLAALVVLFALPAVAQAQSVFRFSNVDFEPEPYVELERARQDFGGNVFIYFYKEGHPQLLAADSLFLGDEKISALLNDEYARFAIDLESDYADALFARMDPGGPVDAPFVMLLSLEHKTHQAIWNTWGAHPDDRMHAVQLDRMYWKLRTFAEHGSTSSQPGG